jgi:hypothetical protein
MQAIEFDAVVKDMVIPLPSSSALFSGQSVRVVVMYETTSDPPEPASRQDAMTRLAQHPLTIPGFVPFSRDEAHER